MVDICGELLNIGDKVSTKYEQMFRIGIVLGFTKTKVIVGFDFTATGDINHLTKSEFAPFNLTKLINQNVGLRDYLTLH